MTTILDSQFSSQRTRAAYLKLFAPLRGRTQVSRLVAALQRLGLAKVNGRWAGYHASAYVIAQAVVCSSRFLELDANKVEVFAGEVLKLYANAEVAQ